jgi:hypothetical protein
MVMGVNKFLIFFYLLDFVGCANQVIMSETINASSNYDPESRKQVEINLPRLRVQTIKYLLSGGGRKGIVRNVKNSIARISRKEVAIKACEDFMREVVREIKGKAVFNINQGRLFLYKLWRELEASDESYGLLNKLPWYQRPTEERLHIDEFRSGVNKVKPDVLCTKKRGNVVESITERFTAKEKRGRGGSSDSKGKRGRGSSSDNRGSKSSVSRCNTISF